MARSPLFLGTSSESERVMRSAAVRVGLGATMLLSPTLGRRIFGVPEGQDNTALRLMARMWGVRNIVLGVWAVRVQDRPVEDRRLCYQLNAVSDAVDIVALGMAGVFGTGMIQAAIMGSATGISEVVGWVDLLQEVDDPAPPDGVSLA